MKASNVDRPPLRTAGPTLVSVKDTLWFLEPRLVKNPWAMWAEKSTQRPMEMTRVLHEMTSIVRPQKCMNPATSRIVEATQKMTIQEARRLPRKTRTVRKIARREVIMFW